MTDEYLRADPLKFEQVLAVFSSASAAYQHIMAFTHTPEMEVALQQFIRAEDELLALSAPHIDGVVNKLLVIWAEDLAVSEPIRLRR